MNKKRIAWRLAATGLAVAACGSAAAVAPRDLADLSLEQLGNIEVTSVSRRAERLGDAPSSIYVITGEDIRRSGVTSLPEALRLAPNLQVARTTAISYGISARGFNTSGNKLLVLIDGRAVYTPLFSGVFWDAQNVMLEDIDRIEVISGPGATLWGANAVNGVINVTTRSAAGTQGALASAVGGNTYLGGGMRYGGKFGADGHYRVYGRAFEWDNTKRASGAVAPDGWNQGQVGFRADWGPAASNFTLQGDAYRGREDQAAPGKTTIEGMNLVGRWTRQLGNGSDLRVQAYYDHTKRDVPGTFREDLDIFDVEFQHGMPIGKSHRLLWGGGYRYASDSVQNSTGLAFLPADKILRSWNLFVQDEIALAPNLDLTAGLKVESNEYTGIEWLPSVRLAWKPSPQRLLWGAVSRAVRAPSRLDRELFIPGAPPFALAGGPDFRSEVSNVFEIGYRAQPTSAVSYSITAFRHVHHHLRSLEPTGGVFVLANRHEGTTTGLEAWGTYRVNSAWRLSGGLLLLDQNLRRKPESADPTGPSALGNDASHQWLLRSSLDLGPRHELDVMVRHVGALPNPAFVPAYTAVDVRAGWRVSREVELSLTVQNLFDPRHPEFGTVLATRSELERAVFLKLLWRM